MNFKPAPRLCPCCANPCLDRVEIEPNRIMYVHHMNARSRSSVDVEGCESITGVKRILENNQPVVSPLVNIANLIVSV